MTKVQRYKVGYYTDEWGMSSNTPCLVHDDSGYAVKFEDYCKLETELAALKAELREICAAIDDPACDLTLTTVECIKKLKGENEWQPIETAPKDGTVFLGYKRGQFRECHKVPRDDCDMWCFGGTSGADDLFPNIKPTHWMPLPKPPAMAQGENG